MLALPKYARGSEWRRWDLHIHTPNTALNDQFSGWETFITELKKQTEITVIGVTDYLTITNYTKLLDYKNSNGLGSIRLLIPNIEFRLSPPTAKGSAINLHLLVDPSEEDHIEKINEALARLSVEYGGQPYSCTPAGIRSLGGAYKRDCASPQEKLENGTNQFKIDFDNFTRWLEKEGWIKKNSLVAVSAGDDGPSGLRDHGWAAKREEIWRFAHIIFSSNSNNRDFWLAKGKDPDDAKKLGAPKPCIHGSDAHDLSRLFSPDGKRYCWIKADPTFEGLRQILYEPEERVCIGEHPPAIHDLSRVVTEVTIDGKGFHSISMPLNCGLVSIIGPKGSGKSAFADMVSYAGGDSKENERLSFLYRAKEIVKNSKVRISWADQKSASFVVGTDAPSEKSMRYLSQSFVEKLCAEDYSGTELANEIESVIFAHLDPTDTLNASSFSDLRYLQTNDTERERIELAAKIKGLIAEDERLREEIRGIPEKKRRIADLGTEKASLESQMPVANSEEEAAAQKKLSALRNQLLNLQMSVGSFKNILVKIEHLENQLSRFRKSFDEFRKEFLQSAAAVGIPESILDIKFEVVGTNTIEDRRSELKTQIQLLEEGVQADSEPTIKKISEEIQKTEGLVAADQARKNQIQQLQKRISLAFQEIKRLQAEVFEIDKKTKLRQTEIRHERLDAYEQIFQSWKREQQILEALYKPVKKKLMGGEAEEKHLDFYIRREVSSESWLERGNAMLDKRTAHPFGSPSQLKSEVEQQLLPAWSSGEPKLVKRAMDDFLQQLKDKKFENSLKNSVSHSMLLDWVFDYSHIRLSYGLRYQGTELEKLSPGTKGIVLLILYLAMDQDDSRPLIVDQPEENLDSESIYDLLAGYFRKAKQRRQVIVITHNPNLVVNTDSEQIIVASADRKIGGFPSFSYTSGSLENPLIRNRVCSVLEGGEKAFLQREKRYGLEG